MSMYYGQGYGVTNLFYNVPQKIINDGDYALEFNGTDEYLQIALPAELAGFNPATISGGSAPTGWSKTGTPTITYETTEPGSSGCAKFILPQNTGIYKSNLTVGKKYKLAMRYKLSGSSLVRLRSNNLFYNPNIILKESSEWNSVTIVFTQLMDNMFLIFNSGTTATLFIESLTIKEDQGFDLNKDQEMILHSKNWDFERTLGTELNSGTVTIGKKYVVTAGTVEGNAVGTEFLAVTNATTLDASNKVKPINCLLRGATMGTYDAPTDTFTVDSPTFSSVGFQPFLLPYKAYKFSFYVTNYVSGVITVQAGADSTGYTNIPIPSGNGVKECIIYSQTIPSLRYVFVRGDSAPKYSLSYFHFYEIPEWTSTGNHTSDVSIIDKSGTGATNTQSLKVTASGAGRGSELITVQADREFSSDTGFWNKLTGATIADGVGHFTAVAINAGFYRNSIVEIGKTYQITYTIKNYSTGAVRPQCGTGVGVERAANGTYTDYVTCAGSQTLYFYARQATTTLDIDDVSVKEVLGEVSLPSANLESCVSTKKYTLQGEGRLDPASLTYGSNFITNGTDWIDTTPANGLGDGWLVDSANTQTTIVTGNGFIGNAQRAEILSNVNDPFLGSSTITCTSGKIYKIVFKYRSNCSFRVLIGGYNVTGGTRNANTGNATEVTLYHVALANTIQGLRFYFRYNTGITGDYIEIDDVVVTEATPITLTAQLGTKSVTSSALSIVAGTFTKFVLNFEATSGEVNQDLKLWLSGAGSVYVDKLSLTQAYDMWVGGKTKLTRTESNGILGNNGVSSTYMGIFTSVTNLRTEIGISSTEYKEVPTTYPIADSTWHNFQLIMNRTGSMQANVDNNALQNNTTFATFGKYISSQTFRVGLNWVGYLQGQVAYVQVIRFENISQSTFNSAITGLQYPVGGGAEEVLRLTFQDGTSFAKCVKDYSPKNHSISNPNSTMDLSNRKRVV